MKDDMEKWVDKWDAALKKDTFKNAVKPEVKESDKFFATFGKTQKLNESIDAKYWRTLAKNARTPVVNEQETLVAQPTIEKNPLNSKPLKKQREVPEVSDLGEKGAELGNTANPIYPDSRGADFRNKVTPEWSDGLKIREIANMYRNLYDLQVKLNQNPKFGSFSGDSPEIKKIQTQIDEVKYKIDELSDSLSPDFVQDEQS